MNVEVFFHLIPLIEHQRLTKNRIISSTPNKKGLNSQKDRQSDKPIAIAHGCYLFDLNPLAETLRLLRNLLITNKSEYASF